MTHKIKLIFVLGLFTFLLTACGAAVSTETSFARDGSGQRIIYLKVAEKDERLIGGFEHLDKVLKENAPDGIAVNRYEENETSKMIYELKYDFSDIDELRKKTEMITGKESNITWDQEQGAFQGMVTYSEDTSTNDLIQWVKDALKKESISNTVINQIYEEEDNKVNFEGEQVWTGKVNPSFQVDLSPTIKEISVYTVYDDEGKVTKQIKLSFSYEDYMTMDTEEGLAYLKGFSKQFKVDSTCNGYSVSLSGEKELEQFFAKASDTLHMEVKYSDLEMNKPESNFYFENSGEQNIFSNQINVKELYNLNKLLEGFKVSAKTIKDYVSIPKRDSYNKELIHHTYALESTKSYNYIGEYDINDTYYMYFSGGNHVELNSAAVVFSIDENLAGTQTVTILLTKNGMKFTSSQVMEFYSDLGEKVLYQEDEKTATITFQKDISYNKKDEENDIVRLNSFNLTKLKYQFKTDFSIKQYFSVDKMNVRYTINLPISYKVEQFSFGGVKLNQKEMKEREDNEEWTFTTEIEGESEIPISMTFSSGNMIFYGILCVMILLVIGTVVSVYFYFIKKSPKRHEQ